jgi:hypothetical protein
MLRIIASGERKDSPPPQAQSSFSLKLWPTGRATSLSLDECALHLIGNWL